MDNNVLKPCPNPACHSTKVSSTYSGGGIEMWVMCNDCRLCGPLAGNFESAEARWNSLPRHSEPDTHGLRPCEYVANEEGGYGEVPRWEVARYHRNFQYCDPNEGDVIRHLVEDERGRFHEMKSSRVRFTDRSITNEKETQP